MLRRKKQVKGVTLIELMGSVLVFMIGIAALMGVYLQSMTAASRGDSFYTAYNLAKNRLETLKNVSFNDLTTTAETSTVINQDGVPDLTGQFVRSTAVSSNYTGDPNLVQVTVTMRYTIAGKLSETSLQMTTVIFKTS